MSGARGIGDGRVLRGRRNHAAVVQALLDLIGEGELHPTAKTIADRAGLSRRCLFQHFADMESIYEAAGAVVEQLLEPHLADVDADAPLPERLAELLVLRRALLLAVDPIARAAKLQEHHSTQLQGNQWKLHVVMGDQCRQAFAPELARLPFADAEVMKAALGVALSWPVWDQLRNELGSNADRIMAVMGAMVRGLLGDALSTLEVAASPS